jgi:hypothetical protein
VLPKSAAARGSARLAERPLLPVGDGSGHVGRELQQIVSHLGRRPQTGRVGAAGTRRATGPYRPPRETSERAGRHYNVCHGRV